MIFGGEDGHREPLEIDIEDFISVKSFKAKGKRITTWQIDHIELDEAKEAGTDLDIENIEEKEEDVENVETKDEHPEGDTSPNDDGENQPAKEDSHSPQFTFNPETGELSLFNDEDM